MGIWNVLKPVTHFMTGCVSYKPFGLDGALKAAEEDHYSTTSWIMTVFEDQLAPGKSSGSAKNLNLYPQLFPTLFALLTANCSLNTTPCTMLTEHYTLYNVHWTLSTWQCLTHSFAIKERLRVSGFPSWLPTQHYSRLFQYSTIPYTTPHKPLLIVSYTILLHTTI